MGRVVKVAGLLAVQFTLQVAFMNILSQHLNVARWLTRFVLILNLLIILSPSIGSLGVNTLLSTTCIISLLSFGAVITRSPKLAVLLLYLHLQTVILQGLGLTI